MKLQDSTRVIIHEVCICGHAKPDHITIVLREKAVHDLRECHDPECNCDKFVDSGETLEMTIIEKYHKLY